VTLKYEIKIPLIASAAGYKTYMKKSENVFRNILANEHCSYSAVSILGTEVPDLLYSVSHPQIFSLDFPISSLSRRLTIHNAERSVHNRDRLCSTAASGCTNSRCHLAARRPSAPEHLIRLNAAVVGQNM
jgi:hypothetical protein